MTKKIDTLKVLVKNAVDERGGEPAENPFDGSFERGKHLDTLFVVLETTDALDALNEFLNKESK